MLLMPHQILNTSVPVPPTPYDMWDPDVQAYQDTGLTPAVLNNDPVRQVTSQSGTGHNLLNTGGSVRPLLQTSAINGHSSILYDGVNDYIEAGAAPLTTDVTLIFAIKQVSWTNFATIFCDTSNAQPNVTQITSTPNVSLFSTTGTGAANAGAAVGTWVVVSAKWQRTGSCSLRVNLGTRSVQTGVTNNALAGVLFGAFLGHGNNSNIELGRISLFNSYLSSGDEDLAMQVFGTYYGLF